MHAFTMQGVREGRKLEDAIEAGMVQRKGLGKKKRKAAGGHSCKAWAVFHCMMLHVTQPLTTKGTRDTILNM